MPRISDIDVARQLDELAALLAAQQTGISRASLADAYELAHGRPINWRTLLRRLERLVAEGRAVAEGEERSPNRTYRAVTPASANTTPVATLDESRTTSVPALAAATHAPTVEGQAEYILLSPDGAEIRVLITASRLTRKRVGYQAWPS
jgi:hypothetical protein